ncbi:hypothetical protein HGM15179_013591 [Zosterops borbonicus]|uniref:Uncharacterized protein n=1 Tax=Zosterops borbonicus TaxID=364589 RepID=A0A8K1LH39_9PASS|nr:hypothetical protein HGM15179_013591 [Zosterops borbonicus]
MLSKSPGMNSREFLDEGCYQSHLAAPTALIPGNSGPGMLSESPDSALLARIPGNSGPGMLPESPGSTPGMDSREFLNQEISEPGMLSESPGGTHGMDSREFLDQGCYQSHLAWIPGDAEPNPGVAPQLPGLFHKAVPASPEDLQ